MTDFSDTRLDNNYTGASTGTGGSVWSSGIFENEMAPELPLNEDMIREQLSRNIAFLGEEGVEKLRNSFVIIVGAGGVGSWAASMLIRSGVGRIRIIDFDQVSLSSLNRHATAVQGDVGTPKVLSMKKAFQAIAPW
ncbi:hypothetical protein BGW38_010453, partial [Lunasporangiospora selenospora]